MKFQSSVATVLALSSLGACAAFAPARQNGRPSLGVIKSMVEEETSTTVTIEEDSSLVVDSLTHDLISKLRFREAQRELEHRKLDNSGTLSAMRSRLRQATIGITSTVDNDAPVVDDEVLNEAFASKGIEFQDEADPDFEFNDLVRETLEKAEKVHWKGATRKFRKLYRRFGKQSANPRQIPVAVYTSVLTACMEDRLHGARAAEPARKLLELMVDEGYGVASDVANYCIKNAIDDQGNDGTHDGFGGIDTALAMLAAIESSEVPITIEEETYGKLVSVMAQEGSLDDALRMLRKMVVDEAQTPPLQIFADVAKACVSPKTDTKDPEQVMTVLAYAKAAGYELDSAASTVEGRAMLAAGVIASEQLSNIGLGLRFLTAASKAPGCDPDRGDALVATSSPAAQRACTIIHREAINKATKDISWKLSVRLLELMITRGLTPSPRVWRNVVTCCAKAEKSRKATSLLLDWVELSKQNRAERPSIRIFNTVVNACEVCGEEELTVRVLDAMKETHDTEGNLVTFNIALKRLAKQGNTLACEGIIIGMLQNGIEPSVVTYTTAVAATVADPKQPAVAAAWIERMKSRRVQPNVITYNTALASCLDGTLQGSTQASQLATEMVFDIQRQVDSGVLTTDQYTNLIPNFYTRTLARQVMKQLKENWTAGDIDRDVAKTTLRVPLLQVVEFMKTDLAEMAEKQKDYITNTMRDAVVDETETTMDTVDEELEYSTAISSHRAAAV